MGQTIIAADQRLSQSILWQIQRHYFRQNGLKAWQEDVVPHAISCNPVMARAYSDIVFGYLRDCWAAVQAGDPTFDPTQPIYIVELGAGSGRLLFHFLHDFYPRLHQAPFAHWHIKCVLTDFVPSILEFWQAHPKLQPWVELGVLDFALFDVADMRPLSLVHAQQTLVPAAQPNPLILFANYFFDSIPQDSFVIEEGQLCHNLLTVLSRQPEPDLANPTLWERLSLAYEPIPLFDAPYDNEIYNDILAEYEAVLPDTRLTFPNVGLDCVRFWQGDEVGRNGRLLLLSSDRGHTLPESLLNDDDPLPNLHGSFSLMVNYHAIGQYAARCGGQMLHAPHYQDNLQTVACLFGDTLAGGQETSRAFAAAITSGGPDDFFALKTALEPHLHTLTLPQLLSWLRLSRWDADLFRDCYLTLAAQLADEPAWHDDVAAILYQIWAHYLPLRSDDDLADKLNQLLTIMGRLADVSDDGRRTTDDRMDGG